LVELANDSFEQWFDRRLIDFTLPRSVKFGVDLSHQRDDWLRIGAFQFRAEFFQRRFQSVRVDLNLWARLESLTHAVDALGEVVERGRVECGLNRTSDLLIKPRCDTLEPLFDRDESRQRRGALDFPAKVCKRGRHLSGFDMRQRTGVQSFHPISEFPDLPFQALDRRREAQEDPGEAQEDCCERQEDGGESPQAGRAEEAAQRLNVRIESAIRRGERVYLSELYRVRGLAHRDLGALDQAHADIATACDIARSQGAVTFLRRAEESQRTLSAEKARPVNRSKA